MARPLPGPDNNMNYSRETTTSRLFFPKTISPETAI